ncbi:MAG TPA: mannose-1-phosphate guanylyltransferase [Alphaproteobacteria bacterium]|nr:mannose-1-phosphate guanylyltransferase [Alphaproteobacteria bacterium]HAJ46241.1 mannose-1-phosphate guanylyltransferase [Alphaproteobacteria bacterium]
MSNPVKTAMILAAGHGLRMRPLTITTPKPLIKVGGRALLDHAIDRVKAIGVTDIIVNVHHLAEQVIAHCKARKDVAITIQDEREAILDTGGALVRARPFFKDEPFLIFNSDSLWVEGMGNNLRRLFAAWDNSQMDCLMLLAAMWNTIGESGRGDFMLDQLGRVTRREPQRVTPFVFPGVQIMHPRLLDAAPKEPFSTNFLWDHAIEKGRLFGVRLDGRWMHVGTPEALHDAEDYLAEIGA